jgi:RimJ/RimL family protein N-acetyltransferase
MKLNEDYLTVRKCDPHIDTLPHMKAAKSSRGYLGEYLEWGVTAPDWNIQDHTDFLLRNLKGASTQTSYVAYYKDRFAGLFNLGLEDGTLGGQICYWTTRELAGQGIATSVTDYLTWVAFMNLRWAHVQLHIDQENVGSSRVAEKCGFHILQDYKCEKNGTKGSGKMNVWIKYSPDLLNETEEKRNQIFDSGMILPRSMWHVSGEGRLANDLFNNPILLSHSSESK